MVFILGMWYLYLGVLRFAYMVRHAVSVLVTKYASPGCRFTTCQKFCLFQRFQNALFHTELVYKIITPPPQPNLESHAFVLKTAVQKPTRAEAHKTSRLLHIFIAWQSRKVPSKTNFWHIPFLSPKSTLFKSSHSNQKEGSKRPMPHRPISSTVHCPAGNETNVAFYKPQVASFGSGLECAELFSAVSLSSQSESLKVPPPLRVHSSTLSLWKAKFVFVISGVGWPPTAMLGTHKSRKLQKKRRRGRRSHTSRSLTMFVCLTDPLCAQKQNLHGKKKSKWLKSLWVLSQPRNTHTHCCHDCKIHKPHVLSDLTFPTLHMKRSDQATPKPVWQSVKCCACVYSPAQRPKISVVSFPFQM